MSKAVKKPELGKFITVRVTPKFHTQFQRKVKVFGPPSAILQGEIFEVSSKVAPVIQPPNQRNL